MKKYMIMLPISAATLFVGVPKGASAQIAIAEVIRTGVKRVIKAVDLKIQRLQNETIWLQNAQKTIENQLSKLKLAEIAGWTEKQKELYSKYYQELWEIKSAITYYKRLKDLTAKQVELITEYKWAWNLFGRDKHFTPEELDTMQKVYAGILDASVKNTDELLLVVNSFKTQMSDAARLEIIATTADKIDQNLADLKKFNSENIKLSVQRATSLDETVSLKEIYGIDE
ncbi:conjugal transfer protein TraI [Olivibacter jilunii]|uniref:conjugal transfer protein TraI n=1 Tax=Olivibacter jilunii TaxID=985016 RepID=UPI001031C9A1|nr:conjugal transfer protein TraI [Olivibacter jilunii]